MAIESHLITLCNQCGTEIRGLTHDDKPADGGKVLLTIAGLESTFGQRREYVRYEKAYGPGGKYYKDNEVLRSLYAKYGCLAASSFGTFQLMFITAVELGYNRPPMDLQDDYVCAEWATRLIVDRFQKRFKAKTLTDVLDCYNSGYHKDAFIPTEYVKRGIEFFETLP